MLLKLTNCVFKMKRIEQNYSWKSALNLHKSHLCLTKRHLDNLEGQVEVKSPLIHGQTSQ